MSVTVHSTLRAMADIYSLSNSGSEGSARFAAYIEACRSGSLLHGYNPMTNKPVASVIESMLEFDAEQVVHDAGAEAADQLGFKDEIQLFVSVATPGLWTDKLANSIEHRLAPRHAGELLLWFDDEQNEATVRAAATEQAVRAMWWHRFPEPRPPLSAVMAREGLAGLLAGRQSEWSDDVAEVIEVLGDDQTHATAAACLLGDEGADNLGFTPLGLPAGTALRHAVAASSRQKPGLTDVGEADIR